ncbi:MAG TPA: site-specific integrase, partial [Polyangiaceae bacterium]|nr:site-specific integrase [Polyangiaceae bacterium]
LADGKTPGAGLDKDTRLIDWTLDTSNAYMDRRLKQGAHRHSIQGEFRLLIQACHMEKSHDRYPGDPSRLMPIALRDKANFYKPPKTWLDTTEQCQALIDAMSQHRAADGGWKRGVKRQFVIDQGPHVSSAEVVERARAAGIALTIVEVGTARCNERYAAARAVKRKRHTVDRKLHVAAYIHSGMRDAELDLPCPEDIDLEGSMMHVRGTKTKGADRYVAMSPTMTQIVQQKMIGKRRGEPLFEPWGSMDRDLKLAWRTARAAHFAQCDKEGQLPVGMWPETISANTLRRTFCSLMYNAGVPPQVCAELMGHDSLDMVMQVYGHLSKDALRAAVYKLPAFTLPPAPQAPGKPALPVCHGDRHSGHPRSAKGPGGAVGTVTVLVSVESRKTGLDAQNERRLAEQNR